MDEPKPTEDIELRPSTATATAAAATATATATTPSQDHGFSGLLEGDADEDDYLANVMFPLNGNQQTLIVQDLWYEVSLPQSFAEKKKNKDWFGKNPPKKSILKGINFKASPGKLFAIMGSSGGGKTTLLDLVSARNNEGNITGEIKLNDQPVSRKLIRQVGAYVTQDDRFLPHITVRETLVFIAHMKFPSSMSAAQKMERVDRVLAELGLRHIAGSKIGGEREKGISGGERRRLSIGCQLLLDPAILFLDEPTSGLDAYTALYIMKTLHLLAESNRTVVATIHAPRTDIFHLFDDVLLLAQGEMAYSGRAQDAIAYFSSIGSPCPDYSNPCDHFLDVTSVDFRSEDLTEKSKATVQYIVDKFKEHRNIASKDKSANRRSLYSYQEHIPEPVADSFTQFRYLYLRASSNLLFGFREFLFEAFAAISMALIFGGIFWKIGDDQASISDRFGLFFMISNIYPFMVILNTIANFHAERPSFYNERQDGLYNLLPYFFAKLLAELPFHLFFGVIYAIPAYWMIGLGSGNANNFGIFVGILVLSIYTSRSMALAVVALVTDFAQAVLTGNFLYTISAVTCGFIVNVDSIWVGLRWISDMSYLRFSFEALSINEFTNRTFTCDGVSQLCIQTGAQALDIYSMKLPIWRSCVYLCVFMIVCRIIQYLSLRFVNQKPK